MDWALFLCITLLPLALCIAESHPDYQPPYGEKLKPKPFQYEYGLHAADSNAAFNKKEIQDVRGNVFGEVVVSLPDGRIQTTNYNADFYDGYVADVKYVGTPTYPPEQHQDYNGPKFIPVHLKTRPTTSQQQPNPSQSRFQNFPYRKHQNSVQSFKQNMQGPEVSTQEKSRTSSSESMAEIMAKVREDLKNMNDEKQNTIVIPQHNANTQFTEPPRNTEGNMAAIMQQVRDDLQKLEKLRKEPTQPQQNRHSINSVKMSDLLKKMNADKNKRKDNFSRFQMKNPEKPPMMKIKSHVMSGPMAQMVKQEDNFARFQMKNPEKPPMMKIKSHVMPGPRDKMAEIIKQMNEKRNKNTIENNHQMITIKSHVKSPMSIKSHVISSPPPAESMVEIMKKIRQDLKNTNKVELPSPVMQIKSHVKSQETDVSENMMGIVQQIRKGLKTNEKLTIEGQSKKATGFPTKKPIRENVVDFMKKMELMKEKKRDQNQSIMSVKSRVIQQTNQDSDGIVSMKILSHVIPENMKTYYK